MARSDQDFASDLLMTEKQLCSVYTTAATEAQCPNIRGELKNILSNQLDIQNEMFQVLSTKGWYQTEEAQQNKVQQTKDKYTSVTF
jgi:spore coat protein CotF